MTGRRIARAIGTAAVALLLAAALTLAVVYWRSSRKLSTRYDVPEAALVVAMERADITRGEHLARAVGSCTLCHGADFGGGTYADMGPVGRVSGPNLTRGRGGVGATLMPRDWVRAIRYGVRADGTSLIMMPSEVFTNFSDDDLASIIAYVQQVPAVDRDVPDTEFRLLGRLLLGSGRLDILAAPKTRHNPSTPVSISEQSGAGYGRYLAEVSGCHGCHGPGLSGGPVAGPPGLPPASNLTPAGLGSWAGSDFVRAMREGKRPDGAAIDEFMPWRGFAGMSDGDLESIWAYLQGVPARPSGNK